MELLTEFKLDGCQVSYQEGTIVLASTQDPTDRLVLTSPDADAAARIFRMISPKLAGALKDLARLARMKRMSERRGGGRDE